MALVRLPDEQRAISDLTAIRQHLASIGIGYERWEAAHVVAEDAPSEEILDGYAQEIEKLKSLGGYVTADVIDISAKTPGLDVMLARFNREHWHDEDEVRFIIRGRGIFHIRPAAGPLTAIEVEPGDLLTVPRGTRHWFDLCADRNIRAIRLFQDPTGWTPYYTESGAERGCEPACLGQSYIPLESSSSKAGF
ncbi:MAG TPA: cupin domain-containing protein [Pyrinomonadaceae bacterium]|nr:cupin domain-containing protein [Pyrinomonadaceae bacterium]